MEVQTKRYFTIKEVCDLTGYYEYQIDEWINKAILKSRLAKKQDSGTYISLISRTDLYEFLSKQKTKKAAKAKEKLLELVKEDYIQKVDELVCLMREGRAIIRMWILDWKVEDEDPVTLMYESEI